MGPAGLVHPFHATISYQISVVQVHTSQGRLRVQLHRLKWTCSHQCFPCIHFTASHHGYCILTTTVMLIIDFCERREGEKRSGAEWSFYLQSTLWTPLHSNTPESRTQREMRSARALTLEYNIYLFCSVTHVSVKHLNLEVFGNKSWVFSGYWPFISASIHTKCINKVLKLCLPDNVTMAILTTRGMKTSTLKKAML